MHRTYAFQGLLCKQIVCTVSLSVQPVPCPSAQPLYPQLGSNLPYFSPLPHLGMPSARRHHLIIKPYEEDTALRTYTDRTDAGRQLAEALSSYAQREDVILLALPRGGVPVAAEVAKQLRKPLDIFLVRKLGTPGHEELAMGAIAPGGYRVMNRDVVAMARVSEEEVAREEEKERAELNRRLASYRDDRPKPDLSGKTVVLIDDGLATGASMEVAAEAVREAGAARVVVAVPTAPPDSVERIEEVADEVISLITPSQFMAVGAWYESFEQTTDREVRELLAEVWSQGLHDANSQADRKEGSHAAKNQ